MHVAIPFIQRKPTLIQELAQQAMIGQRELADQVPLIVLELLADPCKAFFAEKPVLALSRRPIVCRHDAEQRRRPKRLLQNETAPYPNTSREHEIRGLHLGMDA